MQRIRLVHWNQKEAEERFQAIEDAGYLPELGAQPGRAFLRELADDPPCAVVIDLSRLPSQGRDVALLIRVRKATRRIPLVLIGGAPEKVARIRELLPDAVFGCWGMVSSLLEEAITHPPSHPVVPESVFAAYSGTPLVTKLGITAGSVVALVSAPPGFGETLGVLPEGAQTHEGPSHSSNLTIWFVRSSAELERGIGEMIARSGAGPLWIAWQKKASHSETDLSQQQVRQVALAAGLVDYKICSIDEVWSGLLFTSRKASSYANGFLAQIQIAEAHRSTHRSFRSTVPIAACVACLVGVSAAESGRPSEAVLVVSSRSRAARASLSPVAARTPGLDRAPRINHLLDPRYCPLIYMTGSVS